MTVTELSKTFPRHTMYLSDSWLAQAWHGLRIGEKTLAV
jgi:hypothetical protein